MIFLLQCPSYLLPYNVVRYGNRRNIKAYIRSFLYDRVHGGNFLNLEFLGWNFSCFVFRDTCYLKAVCRKYVLFRNFQVDTYV